MNVIQAPRHEVVIGSVPTAVQPVARSQLRRRTVTSAAAVVCLVLLAGCTASESNARRCTDMVSSGQHSHRMVQVPCPAEKPAG